MKLIFFVSGATMIICSLVSVAYITLMERKILGLMQIRLGPNKVGIGGILQPFSDAIKLYTKEMNIPSLSNFSPFLISPCLSLTLSFLTWFCLPHFSSSTYLKLSVLFILSILGMGVYPILMAGWSSNSNYSLIGGMRSLAQTISYEVSLIFILMSNLFLCSSLNLNNVLISQKFMPFLIFWLTLMIWFISVLAELNRTPFDFAEGESELVSGFNTEYSSGSFAIIFMSEYMMICFFSVMTSVTFFGYSSFFSMYFFAILLNSFLIIWMRATLPRYRYDKLMFLCWKVILPISICNLFLYIFISIVLL